MLDKNAFQGRRILITGAGSGIGRASALLLSSLGADVVLVGRTLAKLEATASMMERGHHICLCADLCDFDRYEELLQEATADGKLDGLLHCAGIAKVTPVKSLTSAIITEIMQTNFFTFLLMTKFFSKKRYSEDGASIVACSSANVHYPQKCMSVYEASKSAIEAAVRGMAAELYERRKLRVNAMVIGPVVTPMAGFQDNDRSAVGSHSDVTPNLMGMASPDHIANMAAFLLSDASDYTTGRNFYVDGGRL